MATATAAKPRTKKASTAPRTAAPRATTTRTTGRPAAKPASAAGFKQAQRAAILLKNASDATRLQVILTLADGERNVGDLCATLGISQPALSHHLALMRHGGIVMPRRAGKQNFYSLTDAGVALAKVVGGIGG